MNADEKQESLRQPQPENLGATYWGLPTPELYEWAIRRREGLLSHLGPLVVNTTPYTGRLPKDKFLVREPSSESKIWWGRVNRPFDPAKFQVLGMRVCGYLQGKDVFIESC
jgi:phosphoenolpyruvate carboxykinase (ATP)